MKKLALLFPFAMIALVACSQRGFDSNVHVTPAPVPNVDFSAYRTWGFGRLGQYADTGIEHMDTDQFRAAAAKHFGDEMTKLGYAAAESDPDMVIMVHVATEKKVDEQKMDDVNKGYDMAWAQIGKNDVWNEGTMIIFAMDPKTGQQLWSSTALAKLQDYVGFQDRLDRFNKTVTLMLADFPKRPQ